MRLKYKNLTIRDAGEMDADILAAWWNDGRVMEHAGFPNGLNKSPQHVYKKLGFVQTGIYADSWKNQAGELQSTAAFELVERDFVNFI